MMNNEYIQISTIAYKYKLSNLEVFKRISEFDLDMFIEDLSSRLRLITRTAELFILKNEIEDISNYKNIYNQSLAYSLEEPCRVSGDSEKYTKGSLGDIYVLRSNFEDMESFISGREPKSRHYSLGVELLSKREAISIYGEVYICDNGHQFLFAREFLNKREREYRNGKGVTGLLDYFNVTDSFFKQEVAPIRNLGPEYKLIQIFPKDSLILNILSKPDSDQLYENRGVLKNTLFTGVRIRNKIHYFLTIDLEVIEDWS